MLDSEKEKIETLRILTKEDLFQLRSESISVKIGKLRDFTKQELFWYVYENCFDD